MVKVSFSHFSKVKRVENRNMQRVLEFLLKRGSGTKTSITPLAIWIPFSKCATIHITKESQFNVERKIGLDIIGMKFRYLL